MFEKFDLKREEIFINSKQGFIGDNTYEDAPAELTFQELIQNTTLRREDFLQIGGGNEKDALPNNYYSLEPAFLDYSLNLSLKKLKL